MNLEFCPECGFQLRREGTCNTCYGCGWNSCDFELPSTEEIIRQQKMMEENQDDYRNKK